MAISFMAGFYQMGLGFFGYYALQIEFFNQIFSIECDGKSWVINKQS